MHVDYFKFETHDDDWETRLYLTWKLFSKKCQQAVYVYNCRRLENLSWRVWVQGKFKLSKLDPAALNWSKESAALWGPVFQVKCDTSPRMTRSKSASDLSRHVQEPVVKTSLLKESTNNLSLMVNTAKAKRSSDQYIDSKPKRNQKAQFLIFEDE
jgi:hypothetical protein